LVEALSKIVQGPATGGTVFIDPTFRDLFERGGIEVMQLFAAAPKRNDQLGFNQKRQVLGDSLARHLKVATELVQGLAVIGMELIEQGAAAGICQGFKDCIHDGVICN
jgi:hypothetical protein